MATKYHVRVVRRPKRRDWMRVLTWFVVVWFGATGATSGILIGSLILNWWSPGHPFYVGIKQTLEWIFQ